MPRRVTLPGTDELFRPTSAAGDAEPASSSGRVKHDEKITVYLSREELLNLEQGRLSLLAQYGVNADRGRIVRESLAMVLEDLGARGADSQLVRRLGS